MVCVSLRIQISRLPQILDAIDARLDAYQTKHGSTLTAHRYLNGNYAPTDTANAKLGLE